MDMSLQMHPIGPVPEETERVARSSFPKSNIYLRIRDELGAIYDDETFASLYPSRGQSAFSPWRLAMITVIQFAENLSDRQAADAVRGRIDWKYLLGLSLTDPGFDHTVLSEFRSRLIADTSEGLLLDTLLDRLRGLELIKPRGRQRTDSTHVLAAVRRLNRLERVGETLRAALNDIAVEAPQWLQALAADEWYERYGSRVENYRLPKTDVAREQLASTIGGDGRKLLLAIDTTGIPELAQLPAVRMLRQVWAEQYIEENGQIRWREVKEMPAPASLISSPYDAEARYSKKRETTWVGYKVHLTETCDPETPHLITNTETTLATVPDDNMLKTVHQSLKDHDLLPAEHLVDKGYTDARVLADNPRDYGVTIVGPVADDPSWQARSGEGFDKSAFAVDWDRQIVTCPGDKQSISWLPNTYPKNGAVFEARFSAKDCTPCPLRPKCTKAKREPRIIGLQSRQHHETLQTARKHQTTEDFKQSYAARAGIEGTHEQAIRRCGLRRCRYIGLPKTRLQHVATAVAINLVRMDAWWTSTPRAKTRCSHFEALRRAA
jgi:transposase